MTLFCQQEDDDDYESPYSDEKDGSDNYESPNEDLSNEYEPPPSGHMDDGATKIFPTPPIGEGDYIGTHLSTSLNSGICAYVTLPDHQNSCLCVHR